MGLLSMFEHVKDLVQDVGSMDEIFGDIREKLTAAHEAGKVDDTVWNAFQEFSAKYEAAGKEEGNDEHSQASIQSMLKFAKVLTDNVDKLPEDVKPAIEKFKNISGLIEKAQGGAR